MNRSFLPNRGKEKRMTGVPPRPRRGKSLVEMLVVMTALMAILATAGRLLHQLSRAERSVREATAIGRAELRLARNFREDVRAASDAETITSDDGAVFRLTIAGGKVEYVSSPGLVHRIQEGSAGRRTNAYRLGPTAVTFAVEDDRLAVLNVAPTPQESSAHRFAAGPLTVVAVVGADRFETSWREDSSVGADGSPIPPVEAPRPIGGAS